MTHYGKPKDPPPTKEELEIMAELDKELGIVPERPTPPPLITLPEGHLPTKKRKRIIGGVFKWLADKWDLTNSQLFLARFIAVVALFAGFGILFPLYLIAWAIYPKDEV